MMDGKGDTMNAVKIKFAGRMVACLFASQLGVIRRVRGLLAAGSLVFLGALLTCWEARAEGPASAGPADPKLIEDLVAANRILADQGVVDGYGHLSVRHDRDPNRYLMSRSLAAEMVTASDIVEFDLDSNAVDPRGRALFIERFIHGEIYKARPDVKAVVHNHSPSVIPFGVSGVPLRPLYHMSAFLREKVPVFEIRSTGGRQTDMLVRNPALGQALAKVLGPSPVALMRGHGAVVVGPSLPHAVFRSVYTEMNARLQTQALGLSRNVVYLDPEEAKRADASMEGTISRPWELWKRKAMAKP
jgi:HCOMODA/2-hydroxy-3-carboxy-muconic semialdehyde decarboxylase